MSEQGPGAGDPGAMGIITPDDPEELEAAEEMPGLTEVTATRQALENATKKLEEEHAALREAAGLKEHNPAETLEQTRQNNVFLLGGDDAEMRAIKGVLDAAGVPYVDRHLTWETADASQYAKDIEDIKAQGKTAVAIELRGSENLPGVQVIDHHNDKTDRPASLMQVLASVGVEPGAFERLKAANDSRYVEGMQDVIDDELILFSARWGHNQEQLDRQRRVLETMAQQIRGEDREAQGVTPEMEKEAESAIARAQETPNGVMVVTLNGGRPSPVTDRLIHHQWPDGHQKLVVICNADKGVPGGTGAEVWFYGNGKVSRDLREHFLRVQEQAKQAGQRDGNEYHTWGGGSGYGDPDRDAFAAVVSMHPSDVVAYTDQLVGQSQTKSAGAPNA